MIQSAVDPFTASAFISSFTVFTKARASSGVAGGVAARAVSGSSRKESSLERMRAGHARQAEHGMERPIRQRVLVFLKGGIGDVVFALPLLGDLRAGFPDAELVGLSHDQGADVLRYAPALDTVRTTGPMSGRTHGA